MVRVLVLMLAAGCVGNISPLDSEQSPPGPQGAVEVQVAVSPPTATLVTGTGRQFTARVTAAHNPGVAWSVVETTGGSVSASGDYLAPPAPGVFHLQATSLADPSASALATVTVEAAPSLRLEVSPRLAVVPPSGAFTFTAKVTGATDTAVSWSVQEGAAGGSISAAGVYTAPSTAGVFHAIATSHADPTQKDTALIDVSDGPMTSYNPCPAQGAPCVILPLGDSLTWGDRGDTTAVGGYRAALFHLALAHTQSITFVGERVSGPALVDGAPFPAQHDGFAGYAIEDGGGAYAGITKFTASHVKQYKPNIVALMIGTNDVNLKIDLPNAPVRLGILLDTILAADPNVLLVVAQIPPSKDELFNANAHAYNAAIPGLVKTRADAGKHILMVDMYTAISANPNFKTEYLNDLLHMKDAGYSKIAEVWYAKIGTLFR
jgi:lysophospholipase L1-like esterase